MKVETQKSPGGKVRAILSILEFDAASLSSALGIKTASANRILSPNGTIYASELMLVLCFISNHFPNLIFGLSK